MVEQINIGHHIQKYILGVLMHRKVARFRDLRPPKTDTNLFSYHLKSLIKAGFITKLESGYALSCRGLTYVDRLNQEKVNIRDQPKKITMLVLTNSAGEVVVQKRDKQPFIDTWTLPNGKLHLDDASLLAAARREAKEKLGLEDLELERAGDCYIRVHMGDELLSVTLAHVFTGTVDDEPGEEAAKLIAQADLSGLPLAPAVRRIVELSLSTTPFFVELSETWHSVVPTD